MRSRTELAETRMAVHAVQIIERLRIRASHLNEITEEDLEAGSELLNLKNSSPDMMGLETLLRQKQAQLSQERRRVDAECWRDLSMVMRDFLNAWEGFSKNEAKGRFLSAQPPPTPSGPQRPPEAYTHNGNIKTNYTP